MDFQVDFQYLSKKARDLQHGPMADNLRKSLQVNPSAVRSTDHISMCLLRAVAFRCGPGANEEGGMFAVSGLGNKNPQIEMAEEDELGANKGVKEKATLKLVCSTNSGGHVGHLFYGMVTVDLLLSLRHKWIPMGEVVPGMKDKMYFESGHGMSKDGGFVLRLSSLKDRVGGTVRVRVSTEEFLAPLASLVWQ